MKKIVLISAAALAAVCGLQSANAFMRFPAGGGGFDRTPDGGYSHTGDAGGFEHSTQVGPNGVAHESDAGGAWHGSAANSYGAYHGSDYGGYYHSTTAGADGVYHTGVNGAYYHQPAVVNSYGGCYNCGVGYWGGAAAGVAVGTAVAVGAADANAEAYASNWPIGQTYGYLPAGCHFDGVNNVPYYRCGAMWLKPTYGANGVNYRVVAAP